MSAASEHDVMGTAAWVHNQADLEDPSAVECVANLKLADSSSLGGWMLQ